MTRFGFRLRPRPPFRLDLTAWTLRRRPENRIDRWDGSVYTRVLAFNDAVFEVRVAQSGSLTVPRLEVEVTGTRGGILAKRQIASTLRRMLGTAVDLREFYAFAAGDKLLDPVAQHFRGMKPPRFPTLFEAMANAIACQQLSLAVGIQLLNRLTEHFGRGVPGSTGSARAFPCPADIASLKSPQLRRLGLNRNKARALIELAHSQVRNPAALEVVARLNDRAAIANLCQFHGIGRWSAEYVLLRGLGRTHVIPGDDVGAQNALRNWLELEETLDYEAVKRLARRWRGYAGLLYFHLLLKRLAEAGHINDAESIAAKND